MRDDHLPTAAYLDSLPEPTEEHPLRILFSACFSGRLCGYDGTSNGEYPVVQQLLRYKNVRPVLFCPEHFSFGTPRELCNIHGGNGYDVLDGKAAVLTEAGTDWSDGMVRGAEQMLAVALEQKVQLAVLMDVSAACGSEVIYDGHRLVEDTVYQQGPGVSAALLIRNGIKVVSQRDYYTLGLVFKKVDPEYVVNPNAIDHFQGEWYRSYFKNQE